MASKENLPPSYDKAVTKLSKPTDPPKAEEQPLPYYHVGTQSQDAGTEN